MESIRERAGARSRSTSTASPTAPTSARSTPRCTPTGCAASSSTATSTRGGSGTRPTSTRTSPSTRTSSIYFDWVAKHDDVYHLGTRRPGRRAHATTASLHKLRAHPQAGGTIGPDEWTDVFLCAGYYVYGWTDIADAFSAAVNHGDYSEIKALWRQRQPAGPGRRQRLRDLPRASSAPTRRGRRAGRGWQRDNWRVYAKAPFVTWDNAWFNAPCRTWPAQVGQAGARSTARHAPPILLIDETHDAATPFEGSLEVRVPLPEVGPHRGRRRDDARRLALGRGLHGQQDRRLPRHGRAARPPTRSSLRRAVRPGAPARPVGSCLGGIRLRVQPRLAGGRAEHPVTIAASGPRPGRRLSRHVRPVGYAVPELPRRTTERRCGTSSPPAAYWARVASRRNHTSVVPT